MLINGYMYGLESQREMILYIYAVVEESLFLILFLVLFLFLVQFILLLSQDDPVVLVVVLVPALVEELLECSPHLGVVRSLVES